MPETGRPGAVASVPVVTGTEAAGTAGSAGTGWPGRWLAWVREPALSALSVIVLYLCYLHVSRTQRVESDGATIAVQAWEMLHGNVLLHGWTTTDVTYYTTELPEYMIVEVIRGLNADVLHVAAALSYALLVVLAAVLARGRATGREAAVRMLIAAGILLAPQPGPGVFILLFQPDHIGTQVPMLATWLVLDRAPRRWYTPVVIGVMLAWIGVADRVVLLVGVAPLVLVCGLRAVRMWRRAAPPLSPRDLRRRGLRLAWYELSLAAAAVVSVPVAEAVVRLIKALGGYTMLPLGTSLVPLSMIPTHVKLFTDGLLGLFGAYFVVASPGPGYAFALLHLAGLALAVWGLWLAIWRFFRCEDMIVQLLAVGIVLSVIAFLISGRPTAYWGVREIAGILPAGAVLAGRMVPGAVLAWKRLARPALAVLAVVLAGYLAALGYAVTRPPVPSASQDLADWLRAHHVQYGLTSYGLSSYQEGNTTTQSAGGVVGLRSVVFANGKLSPGSHEFNATWYDPRRHDINFVVLHDVPKEYQPVSLREATVTFGQPARVYHFKDYVIAAWNKNLLTGLGPPAPDR